MPYDFTQFINDHKSQLISSDIPEYFWYNLFFKLSDEIYDISEICNLRLSADKTEVECAAKCDLKCSSESNIFIFDNAWTFEMNKVRLQLKTMDSLRERVASMLSLETEGASVESVIDCIVDNLWSQVRYYDVTMKLPEERKKLWYILDEVGTCLKHDEESPTGRIVPFIYVPTGVCYSVMWLIKDVKAEECLTVNRVEYIIDPYLRECISYIWTRKLPQQTSAVKTLSPEFFTTHRSLETSPDYSIPNLGCLDRKDDQPILVYSDVEFVKKTLTDNRFRLTENKEDADIHWLFDHFKDYQDFSRTRPRCLINQFPSETVMTTKDLLSALGSGSDWMPETFNLKTELTEFIHRCHELQQQEPVDQTISDECRCNCHRLAIDCGVCVDDKSCRSIKTDAGRVWIVKPWNLARGLGIFISSNVDEILRMVEAYPNEPKIASRYITDPVLFYRSDLDANVKFDIRYMVLISSVQPLRAFTTKVFWLRFANKQFVLANWDEYETHFTVMNYKDGCELRNITYDEFIPMFDSQYPDHPWINVVEKRIHNMLKDLLNDVTRRPDPLRIQHSPQSRAMFAVDLMLEWERSDDAAVDISPKVCEVNYCPDCTRACEYNPDFFNDVFSTLFIDEPHNVVELA